jgi:hypothetical protein
MTNVIQLNKTIGIVPTFDGTVAEMNEAETYINRLAVELDELDFLDFVDAVNNVLPREELDEDLLALVDGFLACI